MDVSHIEHGTFTRLAVRYYFAKVTDSGLSHFFFWRETV
jgi:hypothetical protein